jgi:CheY-like chemotaxis protein
VLGEDDADALRKELARLHELLLHPQRMEAVGTLAAGLAHDMNNVLGSITTIAELLLDQCVDADTRGDLETIVAQAERGAELVRSLLAFSRKGQYRKQPVAIDEVVGRLLLLLAHTLPKTIEVRAERRAGAAAIVSGDPVQLNQVLVNLALNAADAMGGTGTITIASDVAGDRVRLRVSDTGCGMDPATLRRAFEPFFTTKPAGSGTGLGLSLVWGVVKNHDGTIDVASEVGRGTTFTIALPLVADAAASATPPPRRVRRPTSATTILVIDDEHALRNATRRALERFGYKVLEAGDGASGLAVFAEHRDRIGLVILDMGMPMMSGAECFRQLRAQSQVPVLIATGYADDAEARQLVAAGAGLIEKPFASTTLAIEVTQMLRRPTET